MNIGKKILELRKQNNVTQEELAAQLGVTAAAVSKWENSYTIPDIMMLCALADYFDVSTDYLLGRITVRKEAVVVAATITLAEKIAQAVRTQGFTVVDKFSEFRPALSYTLSHENCKYIFTGGDRDIISAKEIDDTPSYINSIHIIGETDADILRGFEALVSNPSLFP